LNKEVISGREINQLASNTVTKNIVDNAVMFKKMVCEVISSRLHSIFRYKEAAHLRKLYEGVVGKDFIDAVEVLKDRHLHEFGFYLDTIPTQEIIAELKEDLMIGLQNGTIDVHVKSTALEIARSNVKLAHEYIHYQIKKAQKKRQEEQMALAEHKSQNDAAAANAKVQADTQAYGMKIQMDLQYQERLAQIELFKLQAIKQIEAPVNEQEFKEDVFLAKIKAAGDLSIKEYLEDRKDDRTAIQASQQSKLKKQAQSDGQPIDFENESNWMYQ